MAKMETWVLTAHVPIPMAEQVDQIAERLERSRGWIMKQALSSWIARYPANGAEVEQQGAFRPGAFVRVPGPGK